jgi:hypothetical protein
MPRILALLLLAALLVGAPYLCWLATHTWWAPVLATNACWLLLGWMVKEWES